MRRLTKQITLQIPLKNTPIKINSPPQKSRPSPTSIPLSRTHTVPHKYHSTKLHNQQWCLIFKQTTRTINTNNHNQRDTIHINMRTKTHMISKRKDTYRKKTKIGPKGLRKHLIGSSKRFTLRLRPVKRRLIPRRF